MSDENTNIGRRISISDSTDDDSDYDDPNTTSHAHMHIRYAQDLADKVTRVMGSQTPASATMAGPSGSSSSSRPFETGLSTYIGHFRASRMNASFTSKPLKKRPTMHHPALPLPWKDNQGVRHVTTHNFSLLRALREANKKLAELRSNENASNGADGPVPKIRRINLQPPSDEAEVNVETATPPPFEDNVNENANADEDSSPEVMDNKSTIFINNPEDENEHVDVETNSARDVTITDEITGTSSGVQTFGVEPLVADTTPQAPKIQEAQLNQSLLTLFECPVCLECMEPPMAQCRRGHLICSTCRDRMLRCPVCRASFTSVRNRAMEQVAEKLRYPCRHGCLLLIALRQRQEHEASCPARLYSCPLPACTAAAMPNEDLINHFLDAHADSVAFGTKGTFRYNRSVCHHDWIMSAHGQIFHVQFQASARNSGVYGSVTYVGPKKESSKYTYEITIVGSERSRKLVYTRETHSDLDCRTDFYTQGDSFFMTFDNALGFGKVNTNHNNVLDFKVEIQPNRETVRNANECV